MAGAALFWDTGFPRLPDTALDFRTPAPWEPPAPPVSAPSARPTPAGAADGPAREQRSLEIVFDVNSSFLPAGADEDLRRLLAGLAPDRIHGIELAAAVNGERVRGASGPDEARRYDRWPAERRLERLAGWLRAEPVLRLRTRQRLVEGDSTRRVTATLLGRS